MTNQEIKLYMQAAQEAEQIKQENNRKLRKLSGAIHVEYGNDRSIEYNKVLENSIKESNRKFKLSYFENAKDRESTVWAYVWHKVKNFLTFEEMQYMNIKY